MSALHRLAPGTVFARDYRVLGLIAEGGMGAVYAAEQLSTGKRRALKVMLQELVSDPKARLRFEQEAKISGQIPSEHVVEVVGAGVDETSSTPWLAMELLEGSDLSRFVRDRGPLGPDMVFQCFQQLGHALGLAHERGIVHRDLKPENLFLATSQRLGVPFTLKVLDFGIAKLTQESRATQRTAAMGSPLWMAPEQTEQSNLSPRTDVWAMGLCAFFLLTGRMYWRSANQDETRLASVLTELLVAPLDPASVRAAQLGVREPLPAGFDAWFARCLARNQAERFENASHAVSVLGPGMSHRDPSQSFMLGSTQPKSSAVPMTVATPRVAATVALAAFPPPGASGSGAIHGAQAQGSQPAAVYGSSPGAVGHGSQPGGVGAPGYGSSPGAVGYGSSPGAVGYGSSPGAAYTSSPGAAYTSSPGAAYATQPAQPALPLVVRLALYGGGLVAALGCTAGITFAALHAWQTFGPGTSAPPPALDAGPRAVDAGAPIMAMTVLDAPSDYDAGVDAGRARVTPAVDEGEGDRPFAWGDGEVHVFRGTGRLSNGAVADFNLTLNRNGTTLDGFFHWTVREVPPGVAGLYPGQTLDEAVSGSWAAPRCDLRTVGTSSSVDIHLTIRENGRLSGRDDGGTRYSGRVAR